MLEGIKELVKQLLKDIDKQPGWAPLLVAWYVAIDLYGPPEKLSIFGKELKLSNELLATVLTYFAYKIGDALDEPVFNKTEEGQRKKRFRRWIDKPREKAQEALGVRAGVYSVSLKLVVSAEKERPAIWIHFFNETAKFARSLVAPLLIFGLFFLYNGRPLLGGIFTITSILMLPLYVLLKITHIRKLYRLARVLRWCSHSKYAAHNLGDMRLFFWDGSFVDAAKAVHHDAQAV